MAPVPGAEMIESQSATIVLSMVATSATVFSMIVLAVIGCACCGGKPASKQEAAGLAAEGKVSKKAPPGDYIELDVVGGDGGGGAAESVKSEKKKKQDFAHARDPAYRSLMGVDDKFEPSNKAK